MVVSLVPWPIVMAVPEIPVPTETLSDELAVSTIKYASLPCLIVRAVAELSLTATLISVPSALMLSSAMSETLVIAPSDTDKEVPTMAANVPAAALFAPITVPSIAPPFISNPEPSISTDPASSFLPSVIFSPEFEVTNFR